MKRRVIQRVKPISIYFFKNKQCLLEPLFVFTQIYFVPSIHNAPLSPLFCRKCFRTEKFYISFTFIKKKHISASGAVCFTPHLKVVCFFSSKMKRKLIPFAALYLLTKLAHHRSLLALTQANSQYFTMHGFN